MFFNNDDERDKLNPANWSHLSTYDHLNGMLSGKLPIQRNSYDVKKGKSPYYYLDEDGNELDHPLGQPNSFGAGNTTQPQNQNSGFGAANNFSQPNNTFGSNSYTQPQNTNYGMGTMQNGIENRFNSTMSNPPMGGNSFNQSPTTLPSFNNSSNLSGNEGVNQQFTNSTEKAVQPLYNDCLGDKRYESFLQRLKSPGYEGTGYVDNPKLVEQPTHTGISQGFLNTILKKYPSMEQAYKPTEGATLNDTLRNLNQEQIDNIYCQGFYKPYRINEINDDRIAYSVFDTHVMSSPSRATNTFQKSLNDMGYPVARDGAFGSETIKALNQVADNNQTNSFMENYLKPNRIDSLGGLRDKKKRPGWFYRTMRY